MSFKAFGADKRHSLGVVLTPSEEKQQELLTGKSRRRQRDLIRNHRKNKQWPPKGRVE